MRSILNKGIYGYIDRFKRYELIKTIVWAVTIALIIGIPWIILKTQMNYFTIIGVVLVLPAARVLVLYLTAAPYHSGNQADHDEIESYVREPMILLSDLIMTRSHGATIIVWEAVIYNGNVYAYVPKQKTDVKEIGAYIQKNMEELGFKRKPLVHDDFKSYKDLIEMLSVNHPSEVLKSEKLESRLRAISL